MSDFFTNMGVMRFPMYLGAVFMFVQIARAVALRVRGAAARGMTVHTILVWGGLNGLLGILGTVLGLSVTGMSIEHAGGNASPALIAGGIRIALSTSIFGLLLLTVAVVAWLALQLGSRAGADATA